MARRKTTSEKIKEGTIRKDRKPVKSKQSNVRGYPEPFEELSEKEFGIFRRLCDHLRGAGGLYDADNFVMTAAAVNLAQMAAIISELREKGPIQEFENGTRNVSPEYSIFEKCNSLFFRHSRALGLDPKSRQDMLIFIEQADADDDDPLAGKVPGAA